LRETGNARETDALLKPTDSKTFRLAGSVATVLLLTLWIAILNGMLLPHVLHTATGSQLRLLHFVPFGSWYVPFLALAAAIIAFGWLAKKYFGTAGQILSEIRDQPHIPLGFTVILVTAFCMYSLEHAPTEATAARLAVTAISVLSVFFCWLLWTALITSAARFPIWKNADKFMLPAMILGFLLLAVRLVTIPFPITGDEPSYLHYAHTLAQYGKISVDEAVTLKFDSLNNLSPVFRPHMMPSGNYFFPIHYLGSSLLIIPAYWLGLFLGRPVFAIRVFLVMCYGCAIFLSVKSTRKLLGPGISTLLSAAVMALTLPLLAISYELYPEAFCILILAASGWIFTRIGEGQITRFHESLLLFFVIFLPWLHLKFAVFSVAIAITLSYQLLKRRLVKHIIAGVAVVLVGAAVYVGIHLPWYGEFMWMQAGGSLSATGLMGNFVDGENGIIPFLPVIMLVPVGFCSLWKRDQTRCYVIFALIAIVLSYLSIATSQVWNESGAAILRYFAPLSILFVPAIGAALRDCADGQRFFFFISAVYIALVAAYFLIDPASAYPCSNLREHMILDKAFGGWSYREFFPEYAYLEHGIVYPLQILHRVIAFVLILAFTIAISFRRARRHVPLLIALLLVSLNAAAEAVKAPTWTMNATKLWLEKLDRSDFVEASGSRRITRQLKSSVDPKDVLFELRLPIGLKPFEVFKPIHQPLYGTFTFGSETEDGLILGGPWEEFPAGNYHVSIIGSSKAPADKRFGCLILSAKSYRNIPGLPEPECLKMCESLSTATLKSEHSVLVDCDFTVPPAQKLGVNLQLFRFGGFPFTVEAMDFVRKR
jgi:hypothetical protein